MIQPPRHVPSVTIVLSHAVGSWSKSRPALSFTGCGPSGFALQAEIAAAISVTATNSRKEGARMNRSVERSDSSNLRVYERPTSYGALRDAMGKT